MTYAELIQRLQDWLETSEATMVSNLDFMIELAEHRIYKTVDLDAARVQTSVALTGSDPEVTLPSDIQTLRTVTLLSGTSRTLLDQKDPSYIDDYTGDRTVEGTPRFYGWLNDSTLLLGPAPLAATTDSVVIDHTIRPTPLSSSNTTTWLSTFAPDTLLYSTLLEIATFLKQEPDIIQDFTTKYQDAIQGLLMEQNYLNRQDENRYGRVKVNGQ